MSKATNSIYGAIHEIDLVELSKLLAVKSSNIYVELLLESRWLKDIENQAAFQILTNSNIKVIADKRKSGLMHNKYLIIDDQFIWTGSANFTYNGFFKNYNDGILIRNQKIVSQYQSDYFRIQRSKKRQMTKKTITLETKEYGKILVTPIFSRTKNVNPKKEMITQVENSHENIYFLIFAFSSYDLTVAMEKKLQQNIRVMGLFDDSFESDNVTKNWRMVPFQRLWQKGASVKYDDGNAKLHHKTLMVDDRIVITGSFNFSKNAVKNNNENYLIFNNEKINRIYKKRFQDLWQKFPQKTLYEQYIVAKRKNKKIQNFDQFIRSKKIQKQRKKLKNNFQGKIILLNSQGKIGFLVANDFYFYPLYGIDLPIKGTKYFHQQPQHTITHQKIAAMILHKNFNMKIKNKKVLLFDKNKKSINEKILRNGLAYPTRYILKNNNKKYNQIFIDAYQAAKKKQKFLFSKKWNLKISPYEAREKIQKDRISDLKRESRFSEPEYKNGYLIGNRKTKKYYYPNDVQYKKYYKNLNDDKLIFFKNKFHAEKSGYFHK